MASVAIGTVRGYAQTDGEDKYLSGDAVNAIPSGKTLLTFMVRFIIRQNSGGNDRVFHWNDDATDRCALYLRDSDGGNDIRVEIADGGGTVRTVVIDADLASRLDEVITVVAVVDTAAGELRGYEAGSSGSPITNTGFSTSGMPALDGAFNLLHVDSGDGDFEVLEAAIFDGELTTTQIDDLETRTAENITGSPPTLYGHYLVLKTSGGVSAADGSMSNRAGGVIMPDLDAAGATGTIPYADSGITLDSTYASEDETFDGDFAGNLESFGPDEVADLPSSATAFNTSTDVVTTQSAHGLVVGDYVRFRLKAGESITAPTVEYDGDEVPLFGMGYRVATVPTTTSFTLRRAGSGGTGPNPVTTEIEFTAQGTFDAGDILIDRAGNDGTNARNGTHNQEGRLIAFDIGVESIATENSNLDLRPLFKAVSIGYNPSGVLSTVDRYMRGVLVSLTGNGDGTSRALVALEPDPDYPDDGNTYFRQDVITLESIGAAWLEGTVDSNALSVQQAITNNSMIEYPKPGVTLRNPTRKGGTYTSGTIDIDVYVDDVHGPPAYVESVLTDAGASEYTVVHSFTNEISPGTNLYGPNKKGETGWRGQHSVVGKSVGPATFQIVVKPRVGGEAAIYDTDAVFTRPNAEDCAVYIDPGDTESDDVLFCNVDSRSEVVLDGSGTNVLSNHSYIYNTTRKFFAMVSDPDNLETDATELKFNYLNNDVYSMSLENVQGTIKPGDFMCSGHSFRYAQRGPNGRIEGLTTPGDNPVITSVGHGLSVDDLITLADTRTTGGNPINNNATYAVKTVPDVDSFTFRRALTVTGGDEGNDEIVVDGNHTDIISNGDTIEVINSTGGSLDGTYTVSGDPVFSSGETTITVTADISGVTFDGNVTVLVNITAEQTATNAVLGHWRASGADTSAWDAVVVAAIDNGSGDWDIYVEILTGGGSPAVPADGDCCLAFSRDLDPPVHMDAGVGDVDSDATQWGGGDIRGYGRVTGTPTKVAEVASEVDDPGLGGLACIDPATGNPHTALQSSDVLTSVNSSDETCTRTVNATQVIECIGDDTPGTPTASTTGDPDNPARTIRGAALAIQSARNSAGAGNNCERGTALLNLGQHLFGGESATALTADDAEFTVKPATGVSKADCQITRGTRTQDGFDSAGNGGRGLGINLKYLEGLTVTCKRGEDDILKESDSGGTGQLGGSDVHFKNWCGQFPLPLIADSDGNAVRWFDTLFSDFYRPHAVFQPNSSFRQEGFSWYRGCYATNVGADVWRNVSTGLNLGCEGTGAEGTSVHSDSMQYFSGRNQTISNILFCDLEFHRHVRGQPVPFFGTGSNAWESAHFRNIVHDDNQDPSLSNAGQHAFNHLTNVSWRNCTFGDVSPSWSEDGGLRFSHSFIIQNCIGKGFGITKGDVYPGYVTNTAYEQSTQSNLQNGRVTQFTLTTEFDVIDNPGEADSLDYQRPASDFSSNIPAIGVVPGGVGAYNTDGEVIIATDPVGARSIAADSGEPGFDGVEIIGDGSSQICRLTLDINSRMRQGGSDIIFSIGGGARTVIFRFTDVVPIRDSQVNPGSYSVTSRARLTWDLEKVFGSQIYADDTIDDLTLLDPIVESHDDVNASVVFSESPGAGEVQITNSATVSSPSGGTPSMQTLTRPTMLLALGLIDGLQ